MVGDLLNGRTVHSLSYLLSMYPGVQLYFVAPKVVAMKAEIKDWLSSRGVPWEEVRRATGRSGRMLRDRQPPAQPLSVPACWR